MRASLNFQNTNLSFTLSGTYHSIELIKEDGYLHLRFRSKDVSPSKGRDKSNEGARGPRNNYYTTIDTSAKDGAPAEGRDKSREGARDPYNNYYTTVEIGETGKGLGIINKPDNFALYQRVGERHVS